MPSAPRGRGKGRGGRGGLSLKEKACPIAVESRDYKWKLNRRDYGDDSKESRDLARAREAEERQKAREVGDKVDLGKAGDYWEKVADPTTRDRKPIESDRAAYAAQRKQVQSWRQSAVPATSSAWGSWTGVAEKAGVHWEAPKSSGWDDSSQASGWNDGWKQTAIAASGSASAAPASKWSGWSERSYAPEDKARRAADRQREMEARRQTSQAQAPVAPAPNASSSSSAPPVSPRPSPSRVAASVPSPPVAAVTPDPLSFSFASTGLNDEALRIHCEQAEKLLAHGAERYVRLVDLSANQLTDKGIECFTSFVTRNGIEVEEIRVHGNPRLLLENTSLIYSPIGPSLMRSKVAAGNLRELHIDGELLSPDLCWRLCETCKTAAPKPAFRLCLHGKSKQECLGIDGKLWPVFVTARKFDLKIAGLAAIKPDFIPATNEESEASLHVLVLSEDAQDDLVGHASTEKTNQMWRNYQ